MLASGLVTAPILRARKRLAGLLVPVVLAGCGFVSTTPPAATPTDFPGIVADLGERGITVLDYVSGDPGCEDPELAPTAIRFTASGLDQAEPTRMYVYIFRNRDAFQRRRSQVDACARAYVTDPAAFGSIEASPFVVTGPGPWPPRFRAALREAITEAAGTGG